MKDGKLASSELRPELVQPAEQWVPSLVEAMREGYSRDTTRSETPESIGAIAADPCAFIAAHRAEKPPFVELPDGSQAPRVKDTLFWLVQDERFLGSINVRHSLTPQLERFAGHVGYAVRPSERRRGYATTMLRGVRSFAASHLAIERLLLTCASDNAGSIAAIDRNGGRLIDKAPHPFQQGVLLHRYWVPTA